MSFDKKQQIFTGVLTNTILTISEGYGVTAIEVKLISGKGFIKGTKKLGAIDSTLIDLAVDKPENVSSEQSKYIDELVIDCQTGGGGVIQVVAR